MRTATLFNFLVEATLIGSVLILLALLLRPVFRRAVGSRPVLLAWVLIALRLLLPLALPNPAMNALKPTLSQDPGIRPMADQVRTRVADTARSLYWKALEDDSGSSSLSGMLLRLTYAAGNGRLSLLVMRVYLAGLLASAAWMLWENLRFRRRLQRGSVPGPADPHLRIRLAAGLIASCRMGRTVYLPADAPDGLRDAMLLRERAHTALTVHAVLRCVCCAVHWFNPLVWLAAHLSRMDLELACDEKAAAALDEEQRKAYARPMLAARELRRASPRLPVAASCVTLSAGMQKRRIRLVLHPQPPRRAAVVGFAALCAVTALLMFSTDVQSSVANLPRTEVQSIRPTAPISTPEEARGYAMRFLGLAGVAASPAEESAYVVRTQAGWLVECYAHSASAPMLLSFTDAGQVLSFVDPAYDVTRLHPLAAPITGDTLEGQAWCAFLEEFTRRHLPECYAAYHAMEIVRSGRLDGEQFLVVHLLDANRAPLWETVLQAAPVGRVLSFTPMQ